MRRNSMSDTALDNAVLEVFNHGFGDDEVGSITEPPGTWAGLVRDGVELAKAIEGDPETFGQVSRDELRYLVTLGRAGVIMFTDSQGFNTFKYYDKPGDLERAWEMTAEDLSVSDDDNPDYKHNTRLSDQETISSSITIINVDAMGGRAGSHVARMDGREIATVWVSGPAHGSWMATVRFRSWEENLTAGSYDILLQEARWWLAAQLTEAQQRHHESSAGRHFRIRQDDRFVAGEFPTWEAAHNWGRQHVRGFFVVKETDAGGNLLTPERHRSNPQARHYDSFSGMSMREGADEHAAQELVLYIENDAKLFDSNSQAQAIRKNLLRKMKKGVYDSQRADQAWMYLMETGAKAYCKEFCSSVKDWSTVFAKPTRELAAAYFAKDFETEAKLGNFDHIL